MENATKKSKKNRHYHNFGMSIYRKTKKVPRYIKICPILQKQMFLDNAQICAIISISIILY